MADLNALTVEQRRRPSLSEGWRATPTPARIALAIFSASTLAGVAYALLLGQTPLAVFALGMFLAALVVVALIGTVLDVYAAPEDARAAKWRSLAIGIGLFLLVGMFFAATMVRLGSNVFNRAI